MNHIETIQRGRGSGHIVKGSRPVDWQATALAASGPLPECLIGYFSRQNYGFLVRIFSHPPGLSSENRFIFIALRVYPRRWHLNVCGALTLAICVRATSCLLGL